MVYSGEDASGSSGCDYAVRVVVVVVRKCKLDKEWWCLQKIKGVEKTIGNNELK